MDNFGWGISIMAGIITKTSGFYIIGTALIILGPKNEVSYPSTADVQTFTTAGKARAAHQAQFPDQYLTGEI